MSVQRTPPPPRLKPKTRQTRARDAQQSADTPLLSQTANLEREDADDADGGISQQQIDGSQQNISKRRGIEVRKIQTKHDTGCKPAAVPGVCNVRVETCLPVDGPAVAGWEQRHAAQLPADLRAFYLATDGLRIAWDYRVPAGDRFEVGRSELRPLSRLTRLGGARYSPDEPLAQVDVAAPGAPRLNSRWMVFELERCGEHGSVCLAFCRPEPAGPPPSAAIWLLDRACRWHRLADSFLVYFRMMLAHLALPQWQWKFTPYGLPHLAKTWMTLMAPHLLPSNGWSANDSLRTLPPNRVDAALFRSRSKNKKDKEDKADGAESSECKH